MPLPIQQQAVATVSSANANQVKDTARGQLTELVGKLADKLSTQNDDAAAGLDAIIAAIEAKPAA